MPSTPKEMADYFRASRYFTQLQTEIAEYKVRFRFRSSSFTVALAAQRASSLQARHAVGTDADQFRAGVASSKHRLTGKANGYKVPYLSIILASMVLGPTLF